MSAANAHFNIVNSFYDSMKFLKSLNERNELTNEKTKEKTNERTKKRTNGRTYERKNFSINVSIV